MFAPLTVNTPAVRPEGGYRGSEKKKKNRTVWPVKYTISGHVY